MLTSKNVNDEVTKDSPSVKTRKNIGMPDGQLQAQIYTSTPTATCVARKRPVCKVWQVHARAFFKKAFCTHQNCLQRVLHLTSRGIAMIFFAKSILTSRFSHFPHPLLTLLFCHQYGEVIYERMDCQFVCNLVCSLSFERTDVLWVKWVNESMSQIWKK